MIYLFPRPSLSNVPRFIPSNQYPPHCVSSPGMFTKIKKRARPAQCSKPAPHGIPVNPAADPQAAAGRTVRAVAAGVERTYALRSDGRVLAWGSGLSGALGGGGTAGVGAAPGQMGDSLVALDLGTGAGRARAPEPCSADAARTRPSPRSSPLKDPTPERCFLIIRVRPSRSVSLRDESSSFGASRARSRDPEMPLRPVERARLTGGGGPRPCRAARDGGAGATATALSAGWKHACAILADGRVKCWGRNADGQLGVGSAADVGSAPGQMGDALRAVDLGTGASGAGAGAGASGAPEIGRCWLRVGRRGHILVK